MIVLSFLAEFIAATLAFLFIVGLLVAGLLYAKNKLVPSGDIKVVINGDSDNPVITTPGSNLLNVLSGKSIFLPSACGGRRMRGSRPRTWCAATAPRQCHCGTPAC